jgi:hypothetical protein
MEIVRIPVMKIPIIKKTANLFNEILEVNPLK